MTNDQAVKILEETWCGCSDAQGFIFALERLGVLKLDKSAAANCFREIQAFLNPADFVRILNSLEHHTCEIASRK
jgi:hypothetical protein